MKSGFVFCYVTAALAWAAMFNTAAAEEGYGSITGQFVFDGEIPVLKPLETKGKDDPTCPADNVPDDSLVVDKDSKGIENILIYLRSKAKSVHPSLKESKVKQLDFDQKGCRFFPHAMVVRTDQEVLVKSSDPISHNTHTNPTTNSAENFFVQANDQKGRAVSFKAPERVPTLVNCDVHGWMKAYWIVVDHPYAAVTDKDGKFRIDLVPAGEHEFRVWHERPGYLEAGVKTGFKAKVPSNGTFDLGVIKVPAATLNMK